MKVTYADKPFGIDTKRFYFPCVIEAECPHCGEVVKRDFEKHYLSYPTANAPAEVWMSHYIEENGDEHEWTIMCVLRVIFNVVSP